MILMLASAREWTVRSVNLFMSALFASFDIYKLQYKADGVLMSAMVHYWLHVWYKVDSSLVNKANFVHNFS